VVAVNGKRDNEPKTPAKIGTYHLVDAPWGFGVSSWSKVNGYRNDKVVLSIYKYIDPIDIVTKKKKTFINMERFLQN
jgi:hypothetical protein